MKLNPFDIVSSFVWPWGKVEAPESDSIVDVDVLISEKMDELIDLVPDDLSFNDEEGNPYTDMGKVPLDNSTKRVLLSTCIRESKTFHTVVLDSIERGLEVMLEETKEAEQAEGSE